MTISKSLLSKLKNTTLLPCAALINGQWVNKSKSNLFFKVTNPSNREVIAEIPDFGEYETKLAINSAYNSQKEWASKTGKERSIILRRLNDLILANADDLATILTMEMGKPFQEAYAEILYGASFIEWFAEEAKRVYGSIIPGHQQDKRIVVLRQPIGVVATITPWNFPNAMITRKIGPALAVGCSIVCKPASETPLSAIALASLIDKAGFPAGVFNLIITNNNSAIGKELCSNNKIRKLTFTGSTEVGKILMRQCANQIKKISLELGGNAPFIVFDDADIDSAVEGAMISKYRNAGQTCVCANRIYVQASVYDVFANKLRAQVAKLKVGDGFQKDITTGPIINEKSIAKIQNHLKDAMSKGASLTIGGKYEGCFFQPTILTNVTSKMTISKEETFGPIAPLIEFQTVDEVIKMANDTEYGLASYFYAKDLSKVWKVAEALEYGIVGVNTGIISTEVAPFGGIKQSGIGREGSKFGVDDYLEMKYICLAV